jgi:iron complex outermembrane receptor protein
VCLLFALCASVSSIARAQQRTNNTDDDTFGATANVAAPVTARVSEDATAAGTTVTAGGRAHALESVPEALSEVPGAQVQSQGGYGAPATVALRSGQASHVSVLLDEIPLDTPDTGAFDLSLLPLGLLERVEVYRGGAPAWLGDGAIGGVVRLVPLQARDTHAQLELGAGSFGRYELALQNALAPERAAHPSLLAYAHLSGADNDYPYEDGVTRFVSGDERTLAQRNARVDSGDGFLHGAIDVAGGRLSALLLASGRAQGVPGSLALPAEHAHRQLIRALAGVGYARERRDDDGERRYRVQLSASASQQTQRVSDGDELGMGLPIESDDLWRRATVRAGAGVRVLPWLEPSVVASAALDGFAPDNPLAFSAPPRASRRSSEAFALEPRLYGMLGSVRAELRPSLRLELDQARIEDPDRDAAASTHDDAIAPTYRVAGLLAPLPSLALTASAASGKRLPSLFELFGDRAFVAANPKLAPERSRTVEAGVQAAGRAGLLRGSAELHGFLLWVDDLIRYKRQSQLTLRAENAARAKIAGLELGLDGGVGDHVQLTAALSAQRGRNQVDRTLPLQPNWQLLVRPELSFALPPLDRARLFVEAQHVGLTYLDDENLSSLPPRTTLGFGAGVELWQRRLSVLARVRNLFDVNASDVLGRPLPGREILLSLALREDYAW